MAVPNGSTELTAVEVTAVLRSSASRAKEVETSGAARPQGERSVPVVMFSIGLLVPIEPIVHPSNAAISAMSPHAIAIRAELLASVRSTTVSG